MIGLRAIRKKHGMTIRSFAEKIGMNFSYLSRVENGHEVISIKNLEKIAHEFNEPLDELLIAHGYLPDHTKESRVKNPHEINESLKKVSKKIMKETTL